MHRKTWSVLLIAVVFLLAIGAFLITLRDPAILSFSFPTTEAVTQPVASDNDLAPVEVEVIVLVNKERENAGLTPLTTLTGSLQEAARIRAEESAESFSHTRPNGESWDSVLQECGVSCQMAGENLAYGQTSPAEAVADWMASEGHRDNILGDYTATTVSCYAEDGVLYWVQLFLK